MKKVLCLISVMLVVILSSCEYNVIEPEEPIEVLIVEPEPTEVVILPKPTYTEMTVEPSGGTVWTNTIITVTFNRRVLPVEVTLGGLPVTDVHSIDAGTFTFDEVHMFTPSRSGNEPQELIVRVQSANRTYMRGVHNYVNTVSIFEML